jgi:hypothetical protein
VDSFWGTADNRLDPLNIGFPCAVGTAVGVGHLDAESDFLAAVIAFCHRGTSFARDAQKQPTAFSITQLGQKSKWKIVSELPK